MNVTEMIKIRAWRDDRFFEAFVNALSEEGLLDLPRTFNTSASPRWTPKQPLCIGNMAGSVNVQVHRPTHDIANELRVLELTKSGEGNAGNQQQLSPFQVELGRLAEVSGDCNVSTTL